MFLSTILILKIGCRIIAEDQGVYIEAAAGIMKKTFLVGQILNSFDFETDYNSDI